MMNVLCNICQESLMPSDTMYGIRCGHVFHNNCLTRWFKRSKTCPHCRQEARNKVHKVYLTFGNDKTLMEIADLPLEEQVNNLKFQILLKTKDINYYTSKTATLEKQNTGLRKEVRKVESEINQKNSVIHDLKEQMVHLNKRHLKKRLDYETLKKKLSQKEKELLQFKLQRIAKDQVKDDEEQCIIYNHLATKDSQRADTQHLMYDENENENESENESENENENVCEYLDITEVEELINNESKHSHVKKSESKGKSAVKISSISKKGQTDRKKETGNQNDSRTKTEIVTSPNTIQESSTLNATLDKSPRIKKKAKLFH